MLSPPLDSARDGPPAPWGGPELVEGPPRGDEGGGGRAQANGCAAGKAQPKGPEPEAEAGLCEPPEPDAVQALLFRAGGALFAVPAKAVDKAERGRERVAAFDLAAQMGGRARENLVLALRAGPKLVRIRVDEVLEVAMLPLAAIFALPRLAAERHRGGYVLGVALRGEELAMLLDVNALAALAAPPDSALLKWAGGG